MLLFENISNAVSCIDVLVLLQSGSIEFFFGLCKDSFLSTLIVACPVENRLRTQHH